MFENLLYKEAEIPLVEAIKQLQHVHPPHVLLGILKLLSGLYTIMQHNDWNYVL